MNILLAVDGSTYTKKAIAYLLANRERLLGDGHLTVLNVQMQIPPRVRAALNAEMVKTYFDEEAEKILKPIRSALKRSGVSFSAVYAVGHAAEEIVKAQKRVKAQLIVMGSHGRGSVTSLLLGSVAQGVMSRTDVPVLLVR